MLDEGVHVLADGVEVRVGDLLLLAELANHGSDLVVVGVVDAREQVVFDLKVKFYRYRVTYLVLKLKHLFFILKYCIFIFTPADFRQFYVQRRPISEKESFNTAKIVFLHFCYNGHDSYCKLN
jgi:hypothetical protein